MKLPWFKQFGLLFLPTKPAGWVILASSFIFAIYKFIDIDSRSHSASDTLINFFFYVIIIGSVYSVVGYLASVKKK